MWEYITQNEIINPDNLTTIIGRSGLLGGLFIGMLWGFVLQKSQICKYDVVARLFLLQEFTVWRVGTPLLIVASFFIYFFHDIGVIPNLMTPGTRIMAQIMGGLFMGFGIAISGYCPGTSAAALGEGAVDAIFFMLGMLVGSLLYASMDHIEVVQRFLSVGALTTPDGQNITIPALLGVNHWFILIPFLIMLIIFDIGITLWDLMLLSISLPVYYFKRAMDAFDGFLDSLASGFQKEKKSVQRFNNSTDSFFQKFSKEPGRATSTFLGDVRDILQNVFNRGARNTK